MGGGVFQSENGAIDVDLGRLYDDSTIAFDWFSGLINSYYDIAMNGKSITGVDDITGTGTFSSNRYLVGTFSSDNAIFTNYGPYGLITNTTGVPTGEYTISAWYYPTNVGEDYHILFNNDGFNQWQWIMTTGGEIQMYQAGCPSGAVTTSDAGLTANNWYHLVVTRDASNYVRMYKNNVELTLDGHTCTGSIPVSNVRLARRNDGSHAYRGKIDEMGVWTKGLTAGEVSTLYNSGNGLYLNSSNTPQYANLWAGFHFDETGTDTTAVDFSGGQDASMTGGAVYQSGLIVSNMGVLDTGEQVLVVGNITASQIVKGNTIVGNNICYTNGTGCSITESKVYNFSGWVHNETYHVTHVFDTTDKICIGTNCIINPFYKLTLEGGMNVTGNALFDGVGFFNMLQKTAEFYGNVTMKNLTAQTIKATGLNVTGTTNLQITNNYGELRMYDPLWMNSNPIVTLERFSNGITADTGNRISFGEYGTTTINITSNGDLNVKYVNDGGSGEKIKFQNQDGSICYDGDTDEYRNIPVFYPFSLGAKDTQVCTATDTTPRMYKWTRSEVSDYFGNGKEMECIYSGTTYTCTNRNGTTIVNNSQKIVGDLNVTGNVIIGGNVSIKRPYGMFSSTQDQTLALADTAYPVTFNWTEDSYEIVKEGNSNFSILQSGDYLIELSAVFQSAVANKKSHLWVQIHNGTAWNNVPRSNTQMTIRTSGSDYVVAVPFIIDIVPTEKFRIMWGADDNGVFLNYMTNTSWSPETPSIIMTVSKISEITP